MFAGITTNQSVVAGIKKKGGQIRFRFKFAKPDKKVIPGESIAHNGVCLTVVKGSGRFYEVDVVGATLEATNLGQLKMGDKVNLERSLKVGDEIGGHFVTGHIDGLGKVKSIRRAGENVVMTISAPAGLMSMIAPKGSVTCDGVSLTVQAVTGNSFDIALIPHTLSVTGFGLKKQGDFVNLEVDILARYLSKQMQHYLKKNKQGTLSLRRLSQEGF